MLSYTDRNFVTVWKRINTRVATPLLEHSTSLLCKVMHKISRYLGTSGRTLHHLLQILIHLTLTNDLTNMMPNTSITTITILILIPISVIIQVILNEIRIWCKICTCTIRGLNSFSHTQVVPAIVVLLLEGRARRLTAKNNGGCLHSLDFSSCSIQEALHHVLGITDFTPRVFRHGRKLPDVLNTIQQHRSSVLNLTGRLPHVLSSI